jgi:hypothetical protein
MNPIEEKGIDASNSEGMINHLPLHGLISIFMGMEIK